MCKVVTCRWHHQPITALSLFTAFLVRWLIQSHEHVHTRMHSKFKHITNQPKPRAVPVDVWGWQMGAVWGGEGWWRVSNGCHCVGTDRGEHPNDREACRGLLVG